MPHLRTLADSKYDRNLNFLGKGGQKVAERCFKLLALT